MPTERPPSQATRNTLHICKLTPTLKHAAPRSCVPPSRGASARTPSRSPRLPGSAPSRVVLWLVCRPAGSESVSGRRDSIVVSNCFLATEEGLAPVENTARTMIRHGTSGAALNQTGDKYEAVVDAGVLTRCPSFRLACSCSLPSRRATSGAGQSLASGRGKSG